MKNKIATITLEFPVPKVPTELNVDLTDMEQFWDNLPTLEDIENRVKDLLEDEQIGIAEFGSTQVSVTLA